MSATRNAECGMRNERRARPRRVRSARRGNALLEFLLTLPILIFVTGLTIYMSLAMLAKQQALVQARHHLWHAARHSDWSPLKLEGWAPVEPDDEEDYGNRPRGSGDELERLRSEVEPATLQRTSDADAREYWERFWGNLPGRHETHAAWSFEAEGSLWDFLNRTALAAHWHDSSPWRFYHLDAWRIARSGPLRPVFESFGTYLGGSVADHFRPTRDDIINRWFHGQDVLDDMIAVAEEGG